MHRTYWARTGTLVIDPERKVDGVHALHGRTVMVTGAAGGLGKVAVAAAAEAGASVVLVGRDDDRLAAVAAGHPDAVRSRHRVDLTDPAAVRVLAIEEGPRVDVVWHLVGGWRGGVPLPEQPLADWDWLHDQLVRTTVNLARELAGPLATRPVGRFAIVSSPQALAPTSGNAAYAAAKAAAEATVLALAHQLRDTTATANVVVVPSIGSGPGSAVPAEDVAAALVYLASDAASRMNGQRLRLHSGGPS